MDERLSAQLAFLLEADRLKQIERQSLITGSRRRENTAEHSWHLALFALVLGEHADDDIDLSRVVAMVVLHDLVEIDAGDTYAYDDAGYATKVAREQEAADRLFGLLPDDQGAYLRGLWEEYEAAQTPDARFANALDRLQPVLLNHATDGETWAAHGVTADRVRARSSVIAQGSAGLWAAALARIDDAVAKGWISEPE
jgi:5'-deoxynucleotidase YfbR-like HD superfamily hydrolase